jgi:TolB-like protein
MKHKSFFDVITTLLLVMTIAGCAGGAKAAGTLTLDAALLEAAENIDARVKVGTKVAILNFESPADQFSEYAIDELSANMVNSQNLVIVDRKEIDLIRSEFAFQYSGEVSDESMQSIGRMLGAQSIVSGRLNRIGNAYRIVIRVLNVESAAVEAQYRTDIANDSRVKALLAGGKAENVATQQRKTYKIGDGGPGGGTIFSVEGNTYLEESVILGSYSWEEAVKTAKDYRGGGCSDWRLPTIDELALIYLNLQEAGIVNLGDGKYWSSSERDRDSSYVLRFYSYSNEEPWSKTDSCSVRAVRAF